MKAGLYEWAEDAACAGWDDAVFFPEPGRSVALARHICGTCTAQAKCLREDHTPRRTLRRLRRPHPCRTSGAQRHHHFNQQCPTEEYLT